MALASSRNGRWKGTYRTHAGRERSRTFDRKVDADRFCNMAETAKVRGDWADPRLARVTFRAWSERWLATCVALKPKTLAGYESLLGNHVLPAFGDLTLAQIDPVAVREWVARMTASGMSTSRIRHSYRVLSGSLRVAVETGQLARTPCIGIKLPRVERQEMAFLSAAQVTMLAEAAGEWADLVILFAYGGLRWGEAVALRRRRPLTLHSEGGGDGLVAGCGLEADDGRFASLNRRQRPSPPFMA